MIKRVLKRLFSEKTLGKLDYYRFPELRVSWGGPFNGQEQRQKMVASIFSALPIALVVETGTFRGTTTEYLAKLTENKIYTIEANARLYGFSWMRFMRLANVKLNHSDSRAALRDLSQDKQHNQSDKPVLFYLDAHWGEDLPLADELELIFNHWSQALVLIDDFEVADDVGYTYDDYGAGKALNWAYVQGIVQKYGLSAFYPAASSEQETGAKRGCLCLAQDTQLKQLLAQLDTLRPVEQSMSS